MREWRGKWKLLQGLGVCGFRVRMKEWEKMETTIGFRV